MLSKEEILKRVRDLAKELKVDSLPLRIFIAKTGISERQIYNYFDNWTEIIKEAGLTPAFNIRLEDDELFQAMFDTFIEVKDVCTRRKFNKFSHISALSYCRRFGGWQRALSEFYNWLRKTEKSFPYMLILEKRTNSIPKVKKDENNDVRKKEDTYHPSMPNSTRYGSFLNFRGLQHAPINEQGVVFLFGMICFELGYVVEAVKPGFPDCEAKRKISSHKDQWERVKIEFEFQSKNFLEHGHNTENCDLIVCWENNWTDCPIEVLELKNAIKGLSE